MTSEIGKVYLVNQNRRAASFCFHSSFIQSFSAGIFIYITFMSLIPAEFDTVPVQNSKTCPKNGPLPYHDLEESQDQDPVPQIQSVWKLFAFTCGWGALALLSFIT